MSLAEIWRQDATQAGSDTLTLRSFFIDYHPDCPVRTVVSIASTYTIHY